MEDLTIRNSADKIALCRRFAKARASHEVLYTGNDLATARRRYFPKLAGRLVRNASDPKDGFETIQEALDAAARYRKKCRDFLAESAAHD